MNYRFIIPNANVRYGSLALLEVPGSLMTASARIAEQVYGWDRLEWIFAM